MSQYFTEISATNQSHFSLDSEETLLDSPILFSTIPRLLNSLSTLSIPLISPSSGGSEQDTNTSHITVDAFLMYGVKTGWRWEAISKPSGSIGEGTQMFLIEWENGRGPTNRIQGYTTQLIRLTEDGALFKFFLKGSQTPFILHIRQEHAIIPRRALMWQRFKRWVHWPAPREEILFDTPFPQP
ncbi:hypothetical protein NLI96_g3577 [Meripilus lineatus]|uniref:Uncharacterized protein n=1 Tax=Meripilus lineatus TaxID=2056292 RepID=A0AAD5YKP4_9APHY|nr:hypothetical protein NLI96_g3577 [Physisporinus lineatus]